MVEFLSSPFSPVFDDFIGNIRTSCLICSPYITSEPISRLVKSIYGRGLQETLKVHIVTDLTIANLVRGASDIDALVYLTESLPRVEIAYTPCVHAKVCLADEDYALIGSANFTSGGAWRNWEYGVRIRDKAAVAKIRSDMTAYASLGAVVSLQNLRELQLRTDKLREAIQDEQKAVNTKLRELFKGREQEVTEQLLRIRVVGRTFHAILCETILYLLEQRPMTTKEIHTAVQMLHPDLCDDTIDRVIDGRHFGKLWKHYVRTAQVTLARKRQIEQKEASRQWSLIKK